VRWKITYSVKVEWSRRGEAQRERKRVPEEFWETTFQISSVLIFKASPIQIDNVEVLNTGRATHASGIVTRLL
jgi:hypothetical protein